MWARRQFGTLVFAENMKKEVIQDVYIPEVNKDNPDYIRSWPDSLGLKKENIENEFIAYKID